MSKEKDFYWIKLQEHFFEDDKIIYLMSQKNGEKYVIFWIKLLLKCLKNKDSDNKEYGFLRFTDKIPYDDNLLSKVLNTDIDTVRVALEYFLQLEMIEILDDKTLYIEEVNKMIGQKDSSTERVRRHRERKKLLKDETNVTKCNVTKGTYKEVELDIDKEEDKEEDKPDSIESLSFYCPYCFKENKRIVYNGSVIGSFIRCINCGDGIKFYREYNKQQFINFCKSMHKNYKYYSLAELLYKEHLKNDDKFLYGKDLVSTFLRWAGDIRLLCEKDNRDRELIKKVIIWCQSAGNFWIPNILSGKKLREKFNTLYSQYVRSTNQDNKLNGYRESAQEIIKFLNKKAGTSFDINNDAILNFPAVILRGENTKEDCLQVVDIMTSNWKRDPKFKQNLRPSVLFRPGKFTEYLTTWRKVKWVTYDDGETWEKEEME